MGFVAECPECRHRFQPRYDVAKESLIIRACLSGGVYAVELQCPKCGHTEDIMGEDIMGTPAAEPDTGE